MHRCPAVNTSHNRYTEMNRTGAEAKVKGDRQTERERHLEMEFAGCDNHVLAGLRQLDLYARVRLHPCQRHFQEYSRKREATSPD
jgi:hypothetical protein